MWRLGAPQWYMCRYPPVTGRSAEARDTSSYCGRHWRTRSHLWRQQRQSWAGSSPVQTRGLGSCCTLEVPAPCLVLLAARSCWVSAACRAARHQLKMLPLSRAEVLLREQARALQGMSWGIGCLAAAVLRGSQGCGGGLLPEAKGRGNGSLHHKVGQQGLPAGLAGPMSGTGAAGS